MAASIFQAVVDQTVAGLTQGRELTAQLDDRVGVLDVGIHGGGGGVDLLDKVDPRLALLKSR